MIPKNYKSKQIKSSEYSPVGSYPIVDQSSKFICGYQDDEKKLINKDLPLTIFGDHTRHTKFISFPFVAGADGTQLLKPKEVIEDKFFYYLVCWAAGKIGNYGYDRHFKHLKEFHCDYPESKPEQTKIAEILSTVDRAIEQAEALISKQQRIKTGLMQDLLTRGIDKTRQPPLRTNQPIQRLAAWQDTGGMGGGSIGICCRICDEWSTRLGSILQCWGFNFFEDWKLNEEPH